MSKEATEFYKDYQADDTISQLSERLMAEIMKYQPAHVLDFGSGSGKHLHWLDQRGIVCHGIDISPVNVATSIFKHQVPSVAIGNHTHLRHCCNYDVVMTCSVLDHIEHIEGIIQEFKRIANKAIVIAETNDVPAAYYYPHNYEAHGFRRIDWYWRSSGDGAVYNIWVREKEEKILTENDVS